MSSWDPSTRSPRPVTLSQVLFAEAWAAGATPPPTATAARLLSGPPGAPPSAARTVQRPALGQWVPPRSAVTAEAPRPRWVFAAREGCPPRRTLHPSHRSSGAVVRAGTLFPSCGREARPALPARTWGPFRPGPGGCGRTRDCASPAADGSGSWQRAPTPRKVHPPWGGPAAAHVAEARGAGEPVRLSPAGGSPGSSPAGGWGVSRLSLRRRDGQGQELSRQRRSVTCAGVLARGGVFASLSLIFTTISLRLT